MYATRQRNREIRKEAMMPVEIKETLEDARNRLITECRQEPEAQRAGYVNGVLDFYNAIKKQEGKEKENEYHRSLE